MSHAVALAAGIGVEGLWSISRGLTDHGEHKRMMDHADSPRRGDRDGRGDLSKAALRTFSKWFIKVMLDQVTSSAKLLDLDGLEKRCLRLVEDTIDDKRARSGLRRPATWRLGARRRAGRAQDLRAHGPQHAQQTDGGRTPGVGIPEDPGAPGVPAGTS